MNVPGEIALKIDTDGVWYYYDQPLERLGLVRLFYSVLQKTTTGFALITPVEKVPVWVEDVPFAVKDIQRDDSGTITLLLNDETLLPLTSELRLRQNMHNILYVSVLERNGHTFEARFTRNAYFAIAACFQELPDGAYVLRSGDAEFLLKTHLED